MNIISYYPENLSKRDIYKLTKAVDRSAMKDFEDGTEIEITQYVQYEDKNSEGEDIGLFSIATNLGIITTNSGTTIRSFEDMKDLFVEDMQESGVFKAIIKTGTSKAGRTYYYLAIE